VLTTTLYWFPCLKRWNSQVIQPQGHKICYIRADNAGESTGEAYDDILTEIAAGPQYTRRYSKGGTAVAERANQTLVYDQRTPLQVEGADDDDPTSRVWTDDPSLNRKCEVALRAPSPQEAKLYSLCPPAWRHSSQETFSACPQRYSHRLQF
jgi:hypothetical protein